MIKTLTKHGNSLALVIDKPILDLLSIDEKTSLSIATDGRNLIISPAHPEGRQKKFKAILEAGNRRYGKMLKRLAD